MDLSTLRNNITQKRIDNKNIISEFNELKRNKKLLEEVSLLFPFIDVSDVGKLLYHLRDNLSVQKCNCGKEKKFISFSKGYFKTCGNKKCVDDTRLNSIKETTKEKYGVEHTSQLETTKKKHKQTMTGKYGCSHNFTGKLRDAIYEKNEKEWGVKHALQRKESKLKKEETMLNRYGSLDMFSNEKTIKTNIEKYGNKNPMKSEEIANKVSESLKRTFTHRQIEKLHKFDILLLEYNNLNQYYNVLCNKCNIESVVAGATMNSKLRSDVSPCPICNPYIPSYVSNLEIEFKEWLQSLGEILQSSVKTIVPKNELDIYLPNRKIGFEFNGIYWHSELYKDCNYHYKKSMKFLEKGVKIFHIWEDDWVEKKEIVKKRILSLLNKSEKTDARKCEILSIDFKTASKFINDNHLDGNFKAKIYLGAYENEKLIGVMSFSHSRFSKNKDEWEIIRFCTSKNVRGLASKFISRFKKIIDPNKIISFSKIDWNSSYENSVYYKIGFSLDSISPPSSYWNINGKRIHRLNFIKSKISNEENKHMSAVEIMHSKNYYRVWDCGNWKFSWNKSLCDAKDI